MHIQDPIHGYIELDELEQRLIGQRAFQRLRRIRQLGFSNLIYPSTTHTRFEHSLGATYLAGQFADSLGLDDERRRSLRCAALLHDLGHGPFSHTSEAVMARHGKSHEDFSAEKIRQDGTAALLESYGVDPEQVIDLIKGRSELGQVVAGDIDVDRMDYLMRDSYYSGVAHGAIDDATIIRAAEFHEGGLVFRDKFRQALEGLLTARYLMIPTVYHHPSVVRAEKMMERAIDELVEDGLLSVDALAGMDDIDLKYRLRHTDNERAWYLNDCLDAREVFKTALRWDEDDITRQGLEEIARNIGDERDIEEGIAEAAGLDPKHVLVNPPSIPEEKEIDIDILRRGERTSLDAVSRLTKAVRSAEWEKTALEVYCSRDAVEAVRSAAKEEFSDRRSPLSRFLE